MTGFSTLPTSVDPEAGSRLQWQGLSRVLGPGWLKMPILTVGLLGLQMIWSVEMSYASPYLLSLGLSKSLMSIVFLAGPLSGLLVQPLIGVLSDGSRSRFGRRRPYIFFGALVSFGAMYLFGFTRQFANLMTKTSSPANDALTIGLAVFSIYCIDFSINAVQAIDRALLVDILPVSEQERGNAWAGRMLGMGSVTGFFVGNVDLTRSVPFLGGTQLEILCVVTSGLLILTHVITIFNVKERVLRKSTDGTDSKFSLWAAIKDIWENFFQLPRNIKQICLIQLFAWIGWFPVLFWTSLYVGGLHKRNSPVPETDAAQATLQAEATRLGSRALLCNAIASLFASVICPFFVSGMSDSKDGSQESYNDETDWWRVLRKWWNERRTCHLAVLWAISHGVFAVCMLSTFFIDDVVAATIIMTLSGFSWAMTQWAPFALIAEAIHCASPVSSPHYVLEDADDESEEEDESFPLRDRRTNRASGGEPLGNIGEGRRPIFEIKNEEDQSEDERSIPPKRVRFEGSESYPRSSGDLNQTSLAAALGVNPDAQLSQGDIHVVGTGSSLPHMEDAIEDHGVGVSMENPRRTRSMDGRSIEDKAGIILGIHNVFIVIPQFIITGLSSVLFAIMDTDNSGLILHSAPAHPGGLQSVSIVNTTIERGAPSSIMLPRAEGEAATRSADSVAVIFRIGGVSAAVACILALRLARALKQARR